MRKDILRFATMGAAIVMLAACSTGAGMPQPKLTFQHLQPMGVDVRNVETDVAQGNSLKDFAVSPAEAAHQYLESRFRADGTQGTLRAVMQEATVRHVFSPSKGGVKGFLDVGGHDVYDVKMVLRLDHLADDGHVIYGNTIRAQRQMNITEHASISEREQHQLEGMERLFADLDNQVLQIVLGEMKLAPR